MTLLVSVAPFCPLIWVFVLTTISLLLSLMGKREELAPVTAIYFSEWAAKVLPWAYKWYWGASGAASTGLLPGSRAERSSCPGEAQPDLAVGPSASRSRGCSSPRVLLSGAPFPQGVRRERVLLARDGRWQGKEVTRLRFLPFWQSRKSLSSDDFMDGNYGCLPFSCGIWSLTLKV